MHMTDTINLVIIFAKIYIRVSHMRPMDVYQIYLQTDIKRGYKPIRSMPVTNYDYTATKSWYHIQYQC